MAIQISGSTVIHDSQDVQVSGVVTATSFHGDASQLTNLPAAGSSLQATASGTLSDGSTVIVNTDGTVSAAALVTSGWIATFGGTGAERSNGIGADSSGNAYIAGWTDSGNAGSYDILIAKYNTSGVIQWQRTLGGTGFEYSSVNANQAAVDSSGNVYVSGTGNAAGAGSYDLVIAKYNTSGAIQWQRTLGGTSSDQNGGVAVDSSGNVYITGNTNSLGAGGYDAVIAKYNSSGNIQWQRTLGGSNAEYGYGIAVDSSGNVYVSGKTNTSGAGGYDMLIAKYNSSGTIQWQRTLGGTSSDQGNSIEVDSSGNVYVVGDENGGGQVIIVKYNNSGTIQWQRYLDGGSSELGWGMTIDSSDNIYINGVTRSEGNGNQNFLIVKYNTSGDVQWQRYLGGTIHDYGYGIATDNSGSIYVTGYTTSAGAGGDDILIAKLPNDGSATGTYGSYTYAASSLTSGTSSLTGGTPSSTSSTSNLTDQAASFTSASSSLTSSVTSMVSSNLTSENYIGISDAAYTNGQTATVQLIGSVDDAQSGLTPGQKYYVQNNGTLSTTADSPSVLAGKAISSTKLAIKG